MNSCSNLSVLVHSFNRYEHLWPGFFEAWRRHCAWWPISVDLYFGTDETSHAQHDARPFKMLYSGPGEWSDRLSRLLDQIPTKYVWYQQEDHYPAAPPPNPAALLEMVTRLDLFRLQISEVNQYYTLCGGEIPLFFFKKSKYLVSHQPSIWRKSFLKTVLLPGEDPWKNEYEGTKRLNAMPEIDGKIAIYPHKWTEHRCVRGVVQAER